MTEFNLQNKCLLKIEELAKELKITPFAEQLKNMILSGELESATKPFEEIILDLLNAAKGDRENNKITNAIKKLGLHNPNAHINNILFNVGRKGISKREISELGTCDWIRCKRNLILMGPTGVGKTRVADSLAIAAIHAQMKVFYRRCSLLISEISELNSNDEIKDYLKMLGKHDLIYIDDFASGSLDSKSESMLVEIADEISDKHRASILMTTQHDVESWLKNYFITSASGEAFVDRVFTPAVKFDLEGPSMRVNIFQSENIGIDSSFETVSPKSENGSDSGKSDEGSSILVPKRKRGRPRKNKITDCNIENLSPALEKGTNDHYGTKTVDENCETMPKISKRKNSKEVEK